MSTPNISKLQTLSGGSLDGRSGRSVDARCTLYLTKPRCGSQSPESSHRKCGADLLGNLVVFVVCFNSATTCKLFPGHDGIDLRDFSAYEFVRTSALAGQKTVPVGGLVNMGHCALQALSRHLGLPKNTDSRTAAALYIEHCARCCCSAWQRLEAADSDEARLDILQTCFFLPKLVAVHVARFLELANPSLFCAACCSALGPQALKMLSLLWPGEPTPAEDCPTWRSYFEQFADLVQKELAPCAQIGCYNNRFPVPSAIATGKSCSTCSAKLTSF